MTIRLAMAAAAALALTAMPAGAAPYTFKTVGNMPVGGTAGNTLTFDTTTPSTLKLSVTAWQTQIGSNTTSAAYLGAYAGGLGVTGAGDQHGANNLHQIDNFGSYTDFVLLEFNQAVTLTSIVTNSYGIYGIYENDAVWHDAGNITTKAWNSTANFANNSFAPADWHDVAAGYSGAARDTGALTASTKWLVGAAIDPLCDRFDGFKIASITVNTPATPVPEPASWATMILGMGAIGFAMRRKVRASDRAFDARIKRIAAGETA